MNSSKILDEIAKTSIRLLLEEPFYSHILASLNKEVVSKNHRVKSMCLKVHKQQLVLVINEAFWSENIPNEEYRYGLLKHEILHIILMHTVAELKEKDKRLSFIAMDLAANQFVDSAFLPDYSFTLDRFPELNLELNQTWEFYYHQLSSLTEEEVDGLFSEGFCPGHELWNDFNDLTPADFSVQRALIKQLIEHAKQKTNVVTWGSMNQFLREYLESLFIAKAPRINWRKMVRLFANSSRKTKIKNSIKRSSKRFGTVPGIKVERTSHLLVAIDTSGSVTPREFEEFFTEIHHLWRIGTEITIVECDAGITQDYKYQGKPPKFVSGRGGTDFNAPLEFAKGSVRPDGIIYFTDGWALAPEVKPTVPVLWVISSEGIALETEELQYFPGQKIKIEG